VEFAKGGRVTKPTYATLAEDGRPEFVFDADTTKGLDSMAPLLLDRLNTASSKPQLMNVLQSYFRGNTQIATNSGGASAKKQDNIPPKQDNQIATNSGGASAEQQQKIGAVMKGKPSGKGFQGRLNVFGRGRHKTDTGRLKLQDNIPPKQDNQIATNSAGVGGFHMENFMDFLKEQNNYQKNNITYDSIPSIAKLAQKPLSPSSSQIASYPSYEQPYLGPSEGFIPIYVPVPTGGGGNSSGSSGGIIAMGGGSNPFDILYKNG
jgi:hypothetical protein